MAFRYNLSTRIKLRAYITLAVLLQKISLRIA